MARKSRSAITEERERVLTVLRQSGRGLRHQEIRQAYEERYGEPVPYSTLRNRLGELLDAGQIVKSPEHWNPEYRVVQGHTAQPTPPIAGGDSAGHSEATDSVLLSSAAQEARALIRRPRSQRPPVSYNVDFLGAYRPGETWYLARELREDLRKLGHTAHAEQPAGTYARDIIQQLIIDLSWGSSRLEGNRYSRIDTEELLFSGQAAPGASDRDRQMILNHKAAIEFLVDDAQTIGFDRPTVLGIHALLAENLLGNPDDEGRLRARPISIGESVYTPTAIPHVIEENFRCILEKAAAIPDALEQAFFVMVHIPYLQPFIDVNKRTSRLAANIPLIKTNLCPISFVDVPEQTYTEGMLAIYELNDVSLLRDVFRWAYKRSCDQFNVIRQSMGDPDPIRLRYRSELRALVAEVVQSLAWPTDTDLFGLAQKYGVGENDRAGFVAAARRDLRVLRSDILARYQIRLNDFERWDNAIRDLRRKETT